MRIAALDVYYLADATGAESGRAAAIVFDDWAAATPLSEHVVTVPDIAAYEPGAFYKRELPCLLAVLDGLDADLVVIDGYVDLAPGRPGLGRHLHEATGLPVIGVAKTTFHEAVCVPVVRGGSARPLLVTSVGMPVEAAAAYVRGMSGENRVPTLLLKVDQLSRGR
jgi:deoxyribonuclease V